MRVARCEIIKHHHTDKEIKMEIFSKLDAACAASPFMTPLEQIAEMDHFQSRLIGSNTVHIMTIAERINDKGCVTSNMAPIVALEDFKGVGKHTMLDGNHRYKAALKSCATAYPVVYIAKEVWDQFSSLELYQYGLMLNGISQEPRLETNKEDMLKFGMTYWNDKKSLDGLKEAFISMGATKSMADTRTREINKLVKQNAYLDQMGSGVVWINWSDPERLDELKEIKENYKTPGVKVHVVSSKKFSYDALLPQLLFERPKNLVILLHHPTLQAELEWKNKHRDKHEQIIDELCFMLGINKSWETLPKTERNVLEKSAA